MLGGVVAVTLNPDLRQAAHFLELLGGNRHTFQTFDDNADVKDAGLAKIRHGTIAQHQGELTRINASGGGVFVTINCTDGKGRTGENITAVRAVFIDDDNDKVRATDLRLPPSIVVRSGNGRHFYWLTPNAPVGLFTDTQAHLAEVHGTDPRIKDRNRVMRLPGFYHQKVKDGQGKGPILVEIEEAYPERLYSIGDVTRVLPPRKINKPPDWKPTFSVTASTAKERCRRYLAMMPPAIEKNGGDNLTYQAACVAVRDFGLSDSDALDCLAEWNQRCVPPWEIKDLEAKISHANKYGNGHIGNKIATYQPINRSA